MQGMALIAAWLALMLAACAPASVPIPTTTAPETTGIVIDGEYVHTDAFHVPIPDGWRVITSETGQPVTIILAAQDTCALMIVSVDSAVELPAAPLCAEVEIERSRRQIARGAVTITLLAAAQSDRWPQVEPLYERAARALAQDGD